MIFFPIAALLLFAVFAEYYSLKRAPYRMNVSFRTDMALVEPGEQMYLIYTIRNTSILPRLFLSVSVYLDDDIEFRETEERTERYVEDSFTGLCFNRRYFLLPHQSFTEKVRICVTKRGLKPIGRFYLESGDFLGFKSFIREYPMDMKVICTSKTVEDLPDFHPLGGTLGDVSVRRFILEDPTLVYGHRDYTGHEPMKQISWKATARSGRLIVREQDHTLDWNATVLVDFRTESHHELERTLEIVRTVCERLESARIPYALITNGDLGVVPEGLGRQHIYAIQRKIGLAHPVAYYRFSRLIGRIVSAPAGIRNYILIAPDPSEERDQYLAVLDRHATIKTTVFYAKEAAS